MQALKTQINPQSPEFRANAETMRALVEDLRAKVTELALGGGETARARHTARGKLLPRDRVANCSIPARPSSRSGSSPPSACTMATRRRRASSPASAGCRACECMIVANDATVKGGTYYPMTVKKHLRAQEIARTEPPALHLPGRLGRGIPARSRTRCSPTATISAASSSIRRICRAKGIPQIAMVMGSCTAGGAYVPAMSDETVIVRNQGTIFLGGPPLVKAATGEVVSAEDLGGGDVHTRISGVADQLAENDAHAIHLARRIVANLNRMPQVRVAMEPSEEPLYDPAELYGIIPQDTRKPYDVREIIARLVDGSRFDEFKPRYGTTLVTGFARLYGMPVGIVANNGILFSESAPEGRALHRAVRAARRAARCSCRTSPASWSGGKYENGGHRQGRRQDGDRGRDRARCRRSPC